MAEATAKGVTEQKKRAKRIEQLERADLSAVMRTAPGRRVLKRVLAHCKPFDAVYQAGDPPADRLALMTYRDAKKDVGRWLMAQMGNADEALMDQVMKETLDDDRTEAPRESAEGE